MSTPEVLRLASCPRRPQALLPRLLLGLLAALLLGACSDVPYMWQAGMGQLEILRARRPIPEVLADPQVPPAVKRKLALVEDAQRYATEALALPEDGHYRLYADLGRPQVSWLVTGVAELSFDTVESCFPIAGCFGYRGYFDREAARSYADALRAQGYDVFTRPVHAYSTLGWFEDPVLNTFLAGPDEQIAATVIHELAHRRYYLKGDTPFNESFASFLQDEGLARYLTARHGADSPDLARYRAREADAKLFRRIVLDGKARLAALYGSDRSEAEKRTAKPGLFDEMRQDYQRQRARFTLVSYDRWFAQALNNAHLVGFSQYRERVSAFRALFEQEGRDFPRFYRAVEALGDLSAKEREAALSALESQDQTARHRTASSP